MRILFIVSRHDRDTGTRLVRTSPPSREGFILGFPKGKLAIEAILMRVFKIIAINEATQTLSPAFQTYQRDKG
jgi:hypothetical protein